MLKRSMISVCLMFFALSSAPINTGHTHDQFGNPTRITVPVNGGWDARAACDHSSADGLWRFKVVGVTGNISRVDVQIYRNAHPTVSSGEYRVCASVDPNKTQQLCEDPPSGGGIQTAGSLTIKKPKVGDGGSIFLTGGPYCIRPVVFGNGDLTVEVNHP